MLCESYINISQMYNIIAQLISTDILCDFVVYMGELPRWHHTAWA